jgi:DTW domain-containing protein
VPDHPPPEIVHWLAWRPATGDTFEAIIKPRRALAPSATTQVRLDAATLAAGESWDAFTARWAAFLRADDVACAWGRFPLDTLAREGASLPEARLDARVAASGLLGARAGTSEDCARRLEQQTDEQTGEQKIEVPPAPEGAVMAPGRGGVRMAAFCRVVAAMLRTPAG